MGNVGFDIPQNRFDGCRFEFNNNWLEVDDLRFQFNNVRSDDQGLGFELPKKWFDGMIQRLECWFGPFWF